MFTLLFYFILFTNYGFGHCLLNDYELCKTIFHNNRSINGVHVTIKWFTIPFEEFEKQKPQEGANGSYQNLKKSAIRYPTLNNLEKASVRFQVLNEMHDYNQLSADGGKNVYIKLDLLNKLSIFFQLVDHGMIPNAKEHLGDISNFKMVSDGSLEINNEEELKKIGISKFIKITDSSVIFFLQLPIKLNSQSCTKMFDENNLAPFYIDKISESIKSEHRETTTRANEIERVNFDLFSDRSQIQYEIGRNCSCPKEQICITTMINRYCVSGTYKGTKLVRDVVILSIDWLYQHRKAKIASFGSKPKIFVKENYLNIGRQDLEIMERNEKFHLLLIKPMKKIKKYPMAIQIFVNFLVENKKLAYWMDVIFE